MAVNFPNSPSSGDVHSEGGASWRYNGYAWARIPDPGAKGEPGTCLLYTSDAADD